MPGLSETRQYDTLLTTTMANYAGKISDNVFDDYPALSWINGKLASAKGGKRKKVLDGGESIEVELMYEQSSSVKKYTGYEPLNLTPQEGVTKGRYAWRQIAVSITISGLERRSNMGEAKLIDMLETKTMQAEGSMRDQLSRDFFGSNADGKSWDGLGLILDPTATIGGLAPATFTWWVPTSTASGSFAAVGQKDMRILFNTLTYGNETPDGIFTTQTIFQYYEDSLQPQVRYTDEASANAGFENLRFKNRPMYFDRDCTSGQILMLNSKHLKLAVHKDADMHATPFVTPNDQDATSSLILFQGNLIVDERRKHGRLTSVTA